MISYLELGGTLFIPASHKDITQIVSGKKYSDLKSLVIDFEDGLEESAFRSSMESLSATLKSINKESPLIFIRAKDTGHLQILCALEEIQRVDGFVFAKFSLLNADAYLDIVSDRDFLIMPSIEGSELFNHQELHRLKEKIVARREKVLLVRFGLEDMLRQLSMRRDCATSLFDRSATASVIGNFIATFKSAGFGVSGGVYPCYRDVEGFMKDVSRDMQEGLICKTIIHPNQIEPINALYRVSKKEYEEALSIVNAEKKVFTLDEKMIESLTMSSYSEEIVQRAKIYSIVDTYEE